MLHKLLPLLLAGLFAGGAPAQAADAPDACAALPEADAAKFLAACRT